MTYDTQLAPGTYLNTKIIKRVNVGGIEFDEKFLSELVANHLKDFKAKGRPKFSDAYSIYMAENPSAKRRRHFSKGYSISQLSSTHPLAGLD